VTGTAAAKRKIVSELRLAVSIESEDKFWLHVRSPLGDYRVRFVLSPGWIAQLQRLHWKAEDLLPEEDSFLEEIGTSLGEAIFAPSERPVWSPILTVGSCDVVIDFDLGALSAMVLPFELISVESQYLVDLPGVPCSSRTILIPQRSRCPIMSSVLPQNFSSNA